MDQKNILKNLIKKMQNNFQQNNFQQNNFHQKKVLIGFDGFIDEIIEVVKKRENPEKYERLSTISELAENISKMSGLSGNIELVPAQIKLGGNGPIMANALYQQGHKTSYIGALGKNKIHPLFKDFVRNCENVISLTDPGHTDALEFDDGKVMLGKINKLTEVNWKNLLQHISKDELKKKFESLSLIGITNWSSLPEMNSIIKGLNEICSEISHRPTVFFDLADPKKRTNEDILKVLSLISGFQENAEIIFGMNKNESDVIARTLDIFEENVISRAGEIREKLEITAVTIHPLDGAVCATENGNFRIEGPYTPEPKLTTGAGDNYNAGFCSGWIYGFSPQECLALGVYTSGFYVRNCYSPTLEELIDFMEQMK
ncbi:MAG TPA: carbohydrate kinase family protein [Candidatus Cloacimonetes bacterium]|nr:carbohydrate kinase family protein [Candidatus Cloacimonadota bacterium]